MASAAGLPAAQWTAIGTTIRLVVTAQEALAPARALVVAELAALDRACSRFRPDSETSRLARASAGSWVQISDVLAQVLAVSLDVAAATGGAVDPALGADMCLLGYDRDFDEIVQLAGTPEPITYRVARRPEWRDIELDAGRRRVRMPGGVVLDLGAIAKAWSADRCARRIADELGVGVLVSMGGDIATAGGGPHGGWLVGVQDRPERRDPGPDDADAGPSCTVALADGFALATSSTITRSWRRGPERLHHILDPATRRPADPVWRTVSVAARSCVDANAATTAAIVRGLEALPRLASSGLPVRIVETTGRVRTLGGWPADKEVAA